MPHSLNYNSKLNEVDLVYKVLESKGRPMNYQQLILEVLEQLGQPNAPHRMSMILTAINLDTRFVYIGHGEWALKAWLPARGSRRGSSVAALSKASDNDNKDKLELHGEFDDGESLEEDYETAEEDDSDLPFNEEEDKDKEAW